MNIVVVGLSHKTAPVEIREKVAFSPTAMEAPLRRLVELPAIAEAMIVSTCNRVELYAASRDVDAALAQMRRFLCDSHDLSSEELDPCLYELCGAEAIRHVFRVAASLDSMVVGEPQILGQIKTAYGYASDYKTAGIIVNRFMHKAFSVAKRVRTETQIASSAVSVSFAAVELARKIFDTLEDKTVLLIGAGEMCELAARHFASNGVAEVLVTNRTHERAIKLAEEFKGRAILYGNFADHLHHVDIVLSSTGAPDYVLHHRQVEEVIRQRRHKPMFFIDIAVPRDIDPKINEIDNVYLYDVDDLQGVVAANLKERGKEAKKAEAIVDEEIGQFLHWLGGLDVVPTIVALRQCFEEVRRAEVDKTLASLKGLDENQRRAIEAMSTALINKLLHRPVTLLKKAQNQVEGDGYLEALRTLFDLSPTVGDEQNAAQAACKGKKLASGE